MTLLPLNDLCCLQLYPQPLPHVNLSWLRTQGDRERAADELIDLALSSHARAEQAERQLRQLGYRPVLKTNT